MAFEELVTSQQHTAAVALAAVSRDVFGYRSLTEQALLARFHANAALRKLCDATDAVMAGEIARRSATSLGSAGLAQKHGYRTAVELVKATSGMPGRDAAAVVRVGELAQDAADAEAGSVDEHTGELLDERPWLRAVSTALIEGTISIAAADAIRSGLGEPGEGANVADLTAAVVVLLTDADLLDADRLAKEARYLRDQLDEAGIADRESARHNARSLRFFRQPDGMARLTWTMDPETAALIGGIYDRITSPKRGGPRQFSSEQFSSKQSSSRQGSSAAIGPRFVDAEDPASLAAGRDAVSPGIITEDRRTTEQFASDSFSGLIIGGATVDSSQMLGGNGPIVRMLVLQTELEKHAPRREQYRRNQNRRGPDGEHSASPGGHGFIEGESDPVSIRTIERAICTGILQPILFDHTGRAIDIAPDRRLFSRAQRIALATTFGGCVFPGCERPPSWTEAHHINHVVRDGGKTITADGVLLCKHHHLLVHNNGWEILRTGSVYRLIPPSDIDRNQTPILLARRSTAHRELISNTG